MFPLASSKNLNPKKVRKKGRRPPKGIRRHIRRMKAEARRKKKLTKDANSPARLRGVTPQHSRRYGEHHKRRPNKGVNVRRLPHFDRATLVTVPSPFAGFRGGWGGTD
jgi:hypothetical protein